MATKTLESMHSVSIDDIWKYFSTATIIKDFMLKDGYKPTFFQNNQVLATVWERPSLRTRVSFETGFQALGGGVITLKAYPPNAADIIFKEDVRDQANVLESMCDLVMARTYSHETIAKLGAAMDIPLINGMSDMAHPVQQLTDLFTILEHKGKLEGLKVAYMGEGTGNTCQDWLIAAASVGMNFVLATPDYSKHQLLQDLNFGMPDQRWVDEAQKRAKQTGATITFTNDPIAAAKDADVIYTDSWIAYDVPAEKEKANEIREIFLPYQVNLDLLKLAPNAMVMHCQPMYRGFEITEEVTSHPQCAVSPEAENRYHLQKGVMVELLKPGV
ncbi:MAG: ornithine carbamoyltransferase [Thermoleophilia bacterium]